MGLAIDSKIKPPDSGIPMLQIEYEGMVIDHRSSNGVMLWIDYGIISIHG